MYRSFHHTVLLYGTFVAAMILTIGEIIAFIAAQRCIEQMADVRYSLLARPSTRVRNNRMQVAHVGTR